MIGERRTFGRVIIATVLAVVLGTPAVAQAQASDEQRRALTAKPSVVRVYGGYLGRYRLGNDEFPVEIGGTGSGFFISADGYIATNAHVIDAVQGGDDQAKRKLADALRANLSRRYNSYAVQDLLYSVRLVELKRVSYVVLSNGDKLDYEVVASGVPGKGNDCAIIKVHIENAPAITIADSSGVLAADPITVIGYPGVADMRSVLDEKSALEPTITSGTISAVKRAESGEPILQVSAAIEHGSSGGPAVDQNGNVIGLATFGAVDEARGVNVQGFNFLVASSTLLAMIKQTGVALKPSETTALWQQALSSYWNQDYDDTVAKLEEVQRLFPPHGDAQHLLARTLQLKHDGKSHGGNVQESTHAGVAKWIALGAGAVLALVAMTLLVLWKRRRSTTMHANTAAAPFVVPVVSRPPRRKPQALIVDDEPDATTPMKTLDTTPEVESERRPSPGLFPSALSRLSASRSKTRVVLLVALPLLTLLIAGMGLRLWRDRSRSAPTPGPDMNARKTTPDDSSSGIEFVVTSKAGPAPSTDDADARVRFVKMGPSGLVVTRTVVVPAHVAKLEWVGVDPVVLLGWNQWPLAPNNGAGRKAKHDGEVGVLTKAGYRPLPPTPNGAWPTQRLSKPPTDSGFHWDRPWWTLIGTESDEIWLGRCEWGWEGDGGGCADWSYRRLMPSPEVTTSVEPKPVPRQPLPMVAPSSIVQVDLVDDPSRKGSATAHDGVADGAPATIQYLRCVAGKNVVEFPSRDERGEGGFFGVNNLTWISTDPPIYRIDNWTAGMYLVGTPVIFEGCTQSKSFDDATLDAGPDDTVAMIAHGHLSLFQRGREVGHLDDVESIQFSPRGDAGKPTTPSRPAAQASRVPSAMPVTITTVTASSTHASGAGYTFTASNLTDGNLATSWQPHDSGSPAWVRLTFASDITVTSIKIANGFQTNDNLGDEFILNSRIAKARIKFSDDTEIPIQFASDARGFVQFRVPSKLTRSVTLIVDAVHHGTRWNDLAVSEIEVETLKAGTGNPAPVAPAPTPPAPQSTQAHAKITCHDWFNMSGAEQANATHDIGAQVRADYQRNHGRTVEEFRPGDYVAFANAFTMLCKAGGAEDMYTVGMMTAETAFSAH